MKLKNITSEIKQVVLGKALYFNGSIDRFKFILKNALEYKANIKIRETVKIINYPHIRIKNES
jgi:hypothetical protein